MVNVLSSLKQTLADVIAQVVGYSSAYVLLDHPPHWNVGDHAIWLGERQLLEEAGLRASYVGEIRTMNWSAVERTDSETPLLLHGGGNLGDLWPAHQTFREEVIAKFPNRRIIQMPQSVRFTTSTSLERARRCFEAHQNLTILARERSSLEFLQTHFDVPSYLCPDTAFSLTIGQSSTATRDLQTLIRDDRESVVREQDWPSEFPRDDWLGRGPLPRRAVAGIGQRVASRMKRRQDMPGVTRLMATSFDLVSRFHLKRGVEFLDRGRVVITDRLHGHILCCLLDIPHVALDNSYGKVHGCVETWTSALSTVHTATSIETALNTARELLRE